MIGGGRPLLRELWRILTHLLQNADFQSIFALQRGLKNAKRPFPCKIAHSFKKSATKFLCVKTISYKVERQSLTSVKRLAVAKRPCNCPYLLFARRTSAV